MDVPGPGPKSLKLLAISGSARQLSTNTALLKVLADVAPAGVEVTVFDGIGALPVFSPDREGPQTPPEVAGFINRIRDADGLIISSPEYVRTLPGGLKNAIDWLVSTDAIIDKPAAIIHGSHRGDDMLATLRTVLATVTGAFEERIFARFPLISMSPDEVRDFLLRPGNKNRLHDFAAELAARVRT